MDKRTRPLPYAVCKDSLQIERHTQIENKGMGKDILCKWKLKTSWVSILISDKIDFKAKGITTDKEGHFLMIKVLVQQEDINLVKNLHTRST